MAGNSWSLWGSASSEPTKSLLNLKLNPINWSKLVVDPNWQSNYEHLVIFDDTFEHSISNAKFIQWQVIFDLRQLSQTLQINHRKCAEIILNAAPENIGHPEKIVVEVFAGLHRLLLV